MEQHMNDPDNESDADSNSAEGDIRAVRRILELAGTRKDPAHEYQADDADDVTDSDDEVPKSETVDVDAVLAELLTHCRRAARQCFKSPYPDAANGTRVIKASLGIIAAMKKPKSEFTHRFVVERLGQGAPASDATTESNGGVPRRGVPHPMKKS
jgi:hypothetical protein